MANTDNCRFCYYDTTAKRIADTSKERIAEKELSFGYFNVSDIDEYSQLDIDNRVIEYCKNPNKDFRSKVEVHDEYTFIDFTIFDDEEYQKGNFDNKDLVALYIKKNLLYVIVSLDENNSTRVSFDNAVNKFQDPEKEVTLERFIYAFISSIISNDCYKLEIIDQYITELENEVLSGELNSKKRKSNKEQDFTQRLLMEKRELSDMHNYYEQILDITEALTANDNNVLDGKEFHYLSRINHTIGRYKEEIENMRNDINHLQDSYSTYVDLQLNKTMKVFTGVSIIFLPLTFITGWFGMNFKNMPSLTAPNGYTALICAVPVIVVIMILIGIYKKWWND